MSELALLVRDNISQSASSPNLTNGNYEGSNLFNNVDEMFVKDSELRNENTASNNSNDLEMAQHLTNSFQGNLITAHGLEHWNFYSSIFTAASGYGSSHFTVFCDMNDSQSTNSQDDSSNAIHEIDVSAKLNRIREFTGLNNTDLCTMIGVTRQCIYNWMGNNVQVGSDKLLLINRLYAFAKKIKDKKLHHAKSILVYPYFDNFSFIEKFSSKTFSEEEETMLLRRIELWNEKTAQRRGEMKKNPPISRSYEERRYLLPPPGNMG